MALDPERAAGVDPTPRNRYNSFLVNIFRRGDAQAVSSTAETEAGGNVVEYEDLNGDKRSGYPAYSAFLGQNSTFQTFRLFRTLRMRMILLKQDEISKLEDQLDRIDAAEKSELWLGSCRFDNNKERKEVIRKLDEAFPLYDEFVQRSQWALNIAEPAPRELRMQQVWLQANNYIPKAETAYIEAGDRELMNVG